MIEWAAISSVLLNHKVSGIADELKRQGPDYEGYWSATLKRLDTYHPLGYGDPFKNFEQGSDKIRKDLIHMETRMNSDYNQVVRRLFQ